MRRPPRGGPGEFDRRLVRVEQLLDGDSPGAARRPLVVLGHVLRYQRDRYRNASSDSIPAEVPVAVERLQPHVPAQLADTGAWLAALTPDELGASTEAWLADAALVDARVGFWLRVAAGPILELIARDRSDEGDNAMQRTCPVCGGAPQVSVIAEESGEFMAGSPRLLVCGRCAAWWSFPRITCPSCGEDDSRRTGVLMAEPKTWARIDTCDTCGGYVKTFDLRQPGSVDVVPLVDDVATLALDVVAADRGYARRSPSLAGV